MTLLAFASTAIRAARNGSTRRLDVPRTDWRMGQATPTMSAATPTSVIASDTGGTMTDLPALTSASSPR